MAYMFGHCFINTSQVKTVSTMIQLANYLIAFIFQLANSTDIIEIFTRNSA